MRHLKSSVQSLREVFEGAISAKYLAEDLSTFDCSCTCEEVRAFMKEKEYDVVGISVDGIAKYKVYLPDLAEGAVCACSMPINPEECINVDDSVLDALEIIKHNDRVFLRANGLIEGIITKGDLQKVPMRMYAFGIVSLLEMQMLRVIRMLYKDNDWEKVLNDEERLEGARRMRDNRKLRNEQIDLLDCLQFADKVKILASSGTPYKAIGESKRKTKELLGRANKLRDLVAHSQDILDERGAKHLISLLQNLEHAIEALESFEPQVD